MRGIIDTWKNLLCKFIVIVIDGFSLQQKQTNVNHFFDGR